MKLQDIAALLNAIAWPVIAIIAGAILLKQTELIAFLNAIYRGYSDKIAKAKSLTLPLGVRIEIPDEVFKDLVIEKKAVSVEGLGSSSPTRIDLKELVGKYDAGKLFANVREYPSFDHSAVPLIEPTLNRVGWYSVRLFLEFADDVVSGTPHRAEYRADQIAAVHYLLHESFSERVISSTIREKGFEIWISLTDEFTVIAIVEHTNGSTIVLSRYLNLPRKS